MSELGMRCESCSNDTYLPPVPREGGGRIWLCEDCLFTTFESAVYQHNIITFRLRDGKREPADAKLRALQRRAAEVHRVRG